MIRQVTVEQCRLLETRAILADKEQGQKTGGKNFCDFFLFCCFAACPTIHTCLWCASVRMCVLYSQSLLLLHGEHVWPEGFEAHVQGSWVWPWSVKQDNITLVGPMREPMWMRVVIASGMAEASRITRRRTNSAKTIGKKRGSTSVCGLVSTIA